MRALALGAAALLCLSSPASAAPAAATAAAAAQGFRLVERSDFSRYIGGKYIGHVYREARGSLSPVGEFKGRAEYAGEFMVLEETLRDMRSAARRVDRIVPAKLTLGRGSSPEMREDSGYPSLRGLPILPAESLEPGLTWTASGTRALDFEDSGAFVLMPFLAQYRYAGIVDYRGKKAISLTAKFATRWKADARSASGAVASASGTHDLDILIDADTLASLFIRDRFDESFILSAGGSERRSGFSLYFFEGSLPIDRGATGEAIVAAIAGGGPGGKGRAAGAAAAGTDAAAAGASSAMPPGAGPGPLIAGEGPGLDETLGPGSAGPVKDGDMGARAFGAAGLELDTSPEGLVLRVKDLRFVADSDEILAAEKWRLDAIASALKALPGRSFLVAGHSAAVGKAAGELELSIKRAKRVADELGSRGIEASRLLYRGYGSSKPLAPNDTDEGRAKNRRVEITILD